MTSFPEHHPNLMVFACGNPSRGDDALGPVLLERVEDWVRHHPRHHVEAVEDFQFQVEHTLDLQGRDLVLFVDAAIRGPDPYAFYRVLPAPDFCHSTHALTPKALLHAFITLDVGPPPPAFALEVRGHGFRLGRDLSPQARINLEDSWAFLERLLETPSRCLWEDFGTQRVDRNIRDFPGPRRALIPASGPGAIG